MDNFNRREAMKKYLMVAAAAGALLAGSTGAFAEAVKLQLKWVTQASLLDIMWRKPRAIIRMLVWT